MSTNRKFALAYCASNKEVALEIETELQKVDVQIEHISSNAFPEGYSVLTQIKEKNLPTIILYSDNFFKSESCMEDALPLLQNPPVRLVPIITDGKNKLVGANNYNYEPTEFTRIGHLIKYMNHWQEKYLEVRQNRKDISDADLPNYNNKLEKVKSISTSVGEFLRLLKEKDYSDYSNLKSDNFAGLFKKLGIADLHGNYLSSSTSDTENSTPSSSKNIIDELINDEADAAPTEANSSKGIKVSDNKIGQFIPPISTPNLNIENPLSIAQNKLGFNEISDKESNGNGSTFLERVSKKIEKPKSMHYLEDLADKEEEIEIPQEETVDAEVEIIDDVAETIEEVTNELVEEEVQSEPENTNVVEELETEIENPIEDAIEQTPEEPPVEILESKMNQEVYENDLDLAHLAQTSKKSEEEKIEEKETEIEELPPAPEHIFDEAYREKLLSAKALIEDEKIKEANEIYQELIESYPENTEVRFLYASNLAKRLYEYDTATEELEKILQINGQDADAHYLLAEIAETHKDYILAKSYFEKTISIDPSYPGVYYKIGRIIANQFPDQKKLASKYFRKAIKENKRHVDAQYQYAILLNEHLGKYSKAIKHFKRTLKLNPLHPFAAYDLALLYHKLYETQKAKDYYEKACKNNPEVQSPQNDAVFLQLEVNELAHLTPLEAFEKGLHFEDQPSKFQITPEDEDEAKPLVDKIVVITGATSGIGKATAEIFAENGYKLILTGRRTDRLQEMQESFELQYENDIQILPFDVRDRSSITKALNELDEEWKNIDLLINNAGLAKGFAPIHEGDTQDWDTMIDTNIKGLLYMTRAVAPHMVKRGEGHIINVCSTAATDVYTNGNVYCATKSAVDALTKSMRIDLYKHNIRVGQISPAHVEQTEFAMVRFEGDSERANIYNDFNPLTSKDVAEAIFFMATRPEYVMIRDIVLSGVQQASSNHIHRSGRIFDMDEEE